MGMLLRREGLGAYLATCVLSAPTPIPVHRQKNQTNRQEEKQNKKNVVQFVCFLFLFWG